MTGRQDLFDESMRLGHSAAWDLQWDRAIEFYRKALAEFPDNPNALSSLGLALLETEQYKEALAAYHKASKLSPDDPIPVERCAEIFERLGQINDAINQRQASADAYLARKEIEKAISNWRHIARLNPRDLAARSRLAVTFEKVGKSQEALFEYLAVAAILQESNKTDKATEAVQRSIRLVPGNSDANRALRLLQQGKPLPPPPQPRGATAPLRMAKVKEFLQADDIEAEEQQEEEAEPIDAADPEVSAQHQALTILAGMLFDEPRDANDEDGEDEGGLGIGDLTRGRISRDRKSIGQPQMYRYLGQAIDLQTRGHIRQAVKEFQRAMQSGLDHQAAHYNLGYMLKEINQADESRKHLMAALGHPDFDLGANLALGRMARQREDMFEAARYLLQALRVADSQSVAGSQSGQLNQLYDTIQASLDEGDEESLSQIVENTLNFLSGPEWLKRLRQARKQLDGDGESISVVPIAEMLAVGGSDRIFEVMERLNEYMSRGAYYVALEEAFMALDHVPTYLALHSRIADILIAIGNKDAGLKKLAIVAGSHQIRGESGQAADIYSKIVQNSPVDLKSRMRLIEMLDTLDRTEEALEHYLDLAEIYRQMAEIDSSRKTLADALRLTQRAPVSQGWALKILHRMGDIDMSRLDWRRALRVYEQVRTIDPSDENGRQNVVDLNLRMGNEEQAAQELDSYLQHLVSANESTKALEVLEELAREHPGKQILHLRLAEAYRAAGRKADSIAQYDALGEIQLDAGHTNEAIRTIQTIIDMDPPDLSGYEELLRNLMQNA
jgi:tetratricopeptide (TPR) repeat protein